MEEIEQIVLTQLDNGPRSFEQLLSHVRNSMISKNIVAINRVFENAMMNLWLNDEIAEVGFRKYRRKV